MRGKRKKKSNAIRVLSTATISKANDKYYLIYVFYVYV
jgi:hypothetical protein